MTNKKAKNIGSQVYEGNSLMNLLHDFWESGNGERLVALPSLNDNVPGLFDNYRPFIEDEDDDDPDDPDSLEMSRIEEGSKIRILTDVLNKPDWRTLWDFLQYPEIEIRHVQNLDMLLFVHLGEKRASASSAQRVATVHTMISRTNLLQQKLRITRLSRVCSITFGKMPNRLRVKKSNILTSLGATREKIPTRNSCNTPISFFQKEKRMIMNYGRNGTKTR